MSTRSHGDRHLLLPHPASAQGGVSDVVRELAVTVEHHPAEKLVLTYHLTGKLAALQLPEPGPSVRTDGLWRHLCFEAFISREGAGEYWEYNFSPSGAWAAYHFRAYREGMTPLMKGAAPAIQSKVGQDALSMEVTMDLSWLAPLPSGPGLKLGLTAVIEDRARVLTYWALKHAPVKPDFHHADGFVIPLG